MTGVCPECKETFSVPGYRGSKVGNHSCPTCEVPLQGPGAGQRRIRYACAITGQPRTLGVNGVQLDRPHRVQYVEPARRAMTINTAYYDRIAKLDGTVLGIGAVVDSGWGPEADMWRPAILVPLAETEAGDPATWLVNQPLVYVRCKGCGATQLDTEPRPDAEWTPVRESYRGTGRRHGETVKVKMGPHPANTPACPECFPPAWRRR